MEVFLHDYYDSRTLKKMMTRLLSNTWICHRPRFGWILLMKFLTNVLTKLRIGFHICS
jgi:hypothetical protein